MKPNLSRAALVAGSLGVLLAAAVRADDVNVAGFRPATGSDGLVATEGARPLTKEDGRIELRLWYDGAYKPVQIPAQPTGRAAMIFNRNEGWVGINLYLIGPLSFAAQLPITINQFGYFNDAHSLGSPSTTQGIGDVRLTPRLALLRQEDFGINLALQGSVEIPTANSVTLTTDTKVNGEALLAVSRLFGGDDPSGMAFELLGNVYGRLRPDRELANYDIGSGAGARLGAVVHTGDVAALVPARVFGEIEGQTWNSSIKELASPVEWRAGLGWCFANVSLDLAGGMGLTDGISAAGARWVAGLGYAPSRCGGEAKRIIALRDAENAKKEAIARAEREKIEAEQRAIEAERARRLAEQQAVADRLAAENAAREAAERAQREAAERLAAEQAAREAAEREAAARPQVRVTEKAIEIGQRVEFATGKAKIEEGSFPLLDEVASVMVKHQEIRKIEVQGHTDSTGKAATNRKLSQARANAVAKYLISKGVEKDRLMARGYGSDKPVDTNDTKEGRENNRRVEFQVLVRQQPAGM